jgi:cytochrome o ubiquinol oxidase subunit 2
VLNPAGIIGIEERDLMIDATLLMLIVVIPVLVMTFMICLKYRASNKRAIYSPYWDYSFLAESVWWGFPCVIIIVLSVITWRSSHTLDPFRPLKTGIKPLEIQVVALQWKWLFIYPEQKIATVNYFHFPENTPINFEITSDAPMNSFWIPQLGGQIYAMPGMRTKLHLIADEPGTFRGSSANLSGEGFAGMKFMATSNTQADFDAWVQSVQQADKSLDQGEYKQLLKPSENNPEASFILKEKDLFEQIIMKYMMPMPVDSEMERPKLEHKPSENQTQKV